MAAAARAYLRPADLTIFVVGEAAALAQELRPFGEPRAIAIREFAPPPASGKAVA